MRLALLSDIHGNPIALEAVLKDIAVRGGVDGYWILGDLAAIGYDPVTALEMVAALPGSVFVRGNTDRYTVSRDRPPPTHDEARGDPSLLPTLVEVEGSFAWTQGYVTAAGWLEWLADLPLERRLTLPDGTCLLAVHASPGQDDGSGIKPIMSDKEIGLLLDRCDADLVFVGHTHWPLDQVVEGVRVINVGSVSNPFLPDLRASYVILEANGDDYAIKFRRVDYDRQAVIDAVRRIQHPAADYIISFM